MRRLIERPKGLRVHTEHFYHERHRVELPHAADGQQIDIGRIGAVLLTAI